MKNLNLFGASLRIGFILDCASPGIALPEYCLDSPPVPPFLTESLIIVMPSSNTGGHYG